MFVDFDCAPRKFLLWAMRTLPVDQWVISITAALYNFASSKVRVNDKFSEVFGD